MSCTAKANEQRWKQNKVISTNADAFFHHFPSLVMIDRVKADWKEEVKVQQQVKIFSHLEPFLEKIYYSQKYFCDDYEFRHVIVPKDMLPLVPEEYRGRLLEEREWRKLGIRMSPGW